MYNNPVIRRHDAHFVRSGVITHYAFITTSDYINGTIERSYRAGQLPQLAALLMTAAGSLPFITINFCVDPSGEVLVPWTTTILYPEPHAVIFHCSTPDHTFTEVRPFPEKSPLLHCHIETSLGSIFCGSLSRHIANAINKTPEFILRTWCERILEQCSTTGFAVDRRLVHDEPVLISAVKHPTTENLTLLHMSMRDLTILH